MSGQQRAPSEGRSSGAGGAISPPYMQHGRPRSINESRLTPGPSEEPALQDYNLQQSNLALLRAELKLVTHDRDSLRKELNKTLSERDVALRRLGVASASFDGTSHGQGRYGLCLPTGADGASAYATLSRHGSQAMEKWGASLGSKEYEKLKLHYDRAMLDLDTLRKQLNESIRNYDQIKRESETHRQKHKLALQKLEQVASEAGSLRQQCGENGAERDRLQQELKRVQQQLDDELRRKDSGAKDTSDPSHQQCRNAIYKYEGLREEYDALRARYDDVVASHSAAVNKLELAQEEVSRLKAQLEEALQEKSAALRERTEARRERDGLKQQCTAAIRQWDNALRERNEFRDLFRKLQQKQEDSNKEVNQAIASRIKANKEVKRITEERNQAMLETNRILAERGTVHKEMERLQEDCAAAEARCKDLEARSKDTTSELESLRRELTSALAERDRALRKAFELRDQLGAGHDTTGKSSWTGGINTYDAIQQERAKSKDSLDSGRLSDSKSYKERLDDLDTANVEVEKLRRMAEKLQQEVHEVQAEAEVSKRRRDWAFAERDKIVMERESIRQLCDRLRRERDRAVSDQAKALRDADDIRKQRNEANRELQQMREHLEQCHLTGSSSEDGRHLLDSCHHAEWQSVQLSVDKVPGAEGLRGVVFSGGADSDRDAEGNYSPLTVANVAADSAAAGRLLPGDRLVRVDSLDCSNMSGRLVMEAIRNSVGPVRLLVRRRRPVRTTQLLLSDRDYHGIGLEQGVYIGRIQPGSAAARDGTLNVGDRLLMVNGRAIDSSIAPESISQLLDSSASLTITVRPVVGCSSLLHSTGDGTSMSEVGVGSSSPSASSGGTVGGSGGGFGGSRGRERERLSGGKSKRMSTSSEQDGEKGKKWGDSSRSPLAFVRDMVRGGRGHAKERSAPAQSCTDRHLDSDTQSVLAQFDAVLESSEKADKRRRRGRRRDEKNGTWPKCRGGSLGTAGGAIMATEIAAVTQGMTSGAATVSRTGRRRERMPLSMLVDDRSKLDKSYDKSEESLSSPFDPYFLLEDKYSVGAVVGPPTTELGASLTPSDTSIDFSVKSVKLDKEGLEYYVKKSAKYSQSDSESNISPVETGSSLAVPYLTEPASASHPVPAVGVVSGRHLRSLYGPPLSFTPPYMPYTHTHTHAPTARYSSPIPAHLSPPIGAEGALGDPRRLAGYDPTYEPSGGGAHNLYLHGPSPSLDYGAGVGVNAAMGYQRPGYMREHHHSPAQKDGIPGQRIRMPSAPHSRLSSPAGRAPSSTSVTSRASAGSVETTPDRDRFAPPSFSVEVINPGGAAQSTSSTYSWRHKPLPGELRSIVIDRSDEPLGISISCQPNGGVFVAEVIADSLASQVNLQVGDQILEVCGINLRTATHQMAASVLSQCGDSRRILVQYNPDRYHQLSRRYNTHSRLSSGAEEEDIDDLEEEGRASGGGGSATGERGRARRPSRSGSPTPCNSPKPCRDERDRDELPQSGSSTLRSPLALSTKQNTLTRQQLSQVASTLKRSETVKRSDTVKRRQGSTSDSPVVATHRETQHHDSSDDDDLEEASARLVYMETASSGNLGIQLVGGNAVGIYVHSVEPNSSACLAGLQCGDRILEYNGVDLRAATAEQAACELAKPAEKVTLLVLYRHQKYLQVCDQPGDLFYVRALFDYQPENGNGPELKFHKDNILLVDNTMFNGQPGLWRAWLVDTGDGRKLHCGIIPSKFTVEDLMLKRSQGDISGDPGRRSAVSIRRSIFRRKSKHQRSSSRESKELASFSDMALGDFAQEPAVAATPESTASVSSYQRVERLDSYVSVRPVLVVGPLSDLISERLCAEYSHQFVRPSLDVVRADQAAVDQRVQQAAIVDYRRRGSHFQVLTAAAIKEWCHGDRHCVLDIDVALIPRLHRHRIHPIVLLLRFKSVKQIREVRESIYPMEKVCSKAAKDMFELARKLEQDCRHSLSATVQGGGNMAYLCTQVRAAVEQEQSKALWVPCGTI